MKNYLFTISSIFLIMFLASGCGGSSSNPKKAPLKGSLSLDITDAPVDEAYEVVVVFMQLK